MVHSWSSHPWYYLQYKWKQLTVWKVAASNLEQSEAESDEFQGFDDLPEGQTDPTLEEPSPPKATQQSNAKQDQTGQDQSRTSQRVRKGQSGRSRKVS